MGVHRGITFEISLDRSRSRATVILAMIRRTIVSARTRSAREAMIEKSEGSLARRCPLANPFDVIESKRAECGEEWKESAEEHEGSEHRRGRTAVAARGGRRCSVQRPE